MTHPSPAKPPPRAFARRTDPETSHEAARSVDDELPHLEAIVLARIAVGGSILDELVDLTGLDKVTVSPRLKPLEKRGFIVREGKRRGDSGRQQTIWKKK